MTVPTESRLRQQFEKAFEGPKYPVRSPFELIPYLPDGPATEFGTEEITIPAAALGLEYGEHLDFPYESSELLVDDVMRALRSNGVFEGIQ